MNSKAFHCTSLFKFKEAFSNLSLSFLFISCKFMFAAQQLPKVNWLHGHSHELDYQRAYGRLCVGNLGHRYVLNFVYTFFYISSYYIVSYTGWGLKSLLFVSF